MPGFSGHFGSFRKPALMAVVTTQSAENKSHSLIYLTSTNPCKSTNSIPDTKASLCSFTGNREKNSIKVIDLGGGSGSYYILDGCSQTFTSITHASTSLNRPLNADEIDNASITYQPSNNAKPGQCDLFVISSVLQYMSDEERRKLTSLGLAGSLLDRCPYAYTNSSWTIQTRADCRHPCKIFNIGS